MSTWRIQRVKHRKSDKRRLSSGCMETSYRECLKCIFTGTYDSYALKLYILLHISFKKFIEKIELRLIQLCNAL